MFDMKNLNRLKKLDENSPDSMKAFWAFDKAVFAGGALTVQQKQLIAVAVALTTQCPYCIELHNKAARDAGATDAQLAEAALVAAAMRAGAAVYPSTSPFWASGPGVAAGSVGPNIYARSRPPSPTRYKKHPSRGILTRCRLPV